MLNRMNTALRACRTVQHHLQIDYIAVAEKPEGLPDNPDTIGWTSLFVLK
jgi:hypothetical protein